MLLKYDEHQESVEKSRGLSKLSRLKNYITTKIKGIFDRAPKTSNEKTKGESFVIGGVNSSEAIRNITVLEGMSIDELNNRLKPGGWSMEGFLGKDEHVLDVLAKDNDYVLSKGTTHQAIGQTLQLIEEGLAVENHPRNALDPDKMFTVGGYRYKYVRPELIAKGFQQNPFIKEHESGFGNCFGYNIGIKNLDTGQIIQTVGGLHELISKYGFYEGNTSYRTSPQELLKMFPFLVNNSNVKSLDGLNQYNQAA